MPILNTLTFNSKVKLMEMPGQTSDKRLKGISTIGFLMAIIPAIRKNANGLNDPTCQSPDFLKYITEGPNSWKKQ